MRIGIDGSVLAIQFYCGQKNYLKNLIYNLAKIDKKNKYVIFCSKKVPIPNQRNFELRLLPSKLPIFKRQIIMPIVVKNMGLDVFHYPDVWGSVFLKSTKIVTTLHDLAPGIAYPPLYKNIRYTLLKRFNEFVRKFTINNSSVVIVDSKFISNEVIKLVNPDTPIKVIHLGVSKDFKPTKQKEKRNYFLAMTDFSPRKNISVLLEAYSFFIKKTNAETNLKIIISTSYPKFDIIKKAKELKIEGYINILEDISTDRLVKLYNHAISFIYPSLYEGFGLPILEAMACGCPVITSNCGAMKEIAGDSALLINPKSEKSIAGAILKIYKDKKLRKNLIKKGLKRTKDFSWLKTAKRTLEVYKSLY